MVLGAQASEWSDILSGVYRKALFLVLFYLYFILVILIILLIAKY